MLNLGERIKQVRNDSRMTQAQFALNVGVNRAATISNYESNASEPSLAVLRKIAKLDKRGAGWLLTGEGEMFEKKPTVEKKEWCVSEPEGPEWDPTWQNLQKKPKFQRLVNLLTRMPDKKQDKVLDYIASSVEVMNL